MAATIKEMFVVAFVHDMFLLLLIPAVYAASIPLPDLPRVTVEAEVLKRFGVTSDINKPGYFGDLWTEATKNNFINATEAEIMKKLEAMKQYNNAQINLLQNLLNTSAIHLSKQLIENAKPFGTSELAELFVAHGINIFMRIHDVANKLNQETADSLVALEGKSSEEVVKICLKQEEVLVVAKKLSREISDERACSKFAGIATGESVDVNNLAVETAYANGALKTLKYMLLEHETSTIGEILQFAKEHPVYPEVLENLFIQRLTTALEDYNRFYKTFKTHPLVVELTGESSEQIEMIVIRQAKDIKDAKSPLNMNINFHA